MTLILKDRNAKQMQVSAIMHQDANYLHPNRIELIGARDKEIELLGLNTAGVIEWNEYVQCNWPVSVDAAAKYSRSGICWWRSSGMTWGAAIADNSIQPFADFQIIEARERMSGWDLQDLSAEYVFLQRPKEWYVQRRNWRMPDTERVAGPWKSIAALGVRFRTLSIALLRDDPRITKEQERIELPSIEIKPIGLCGDESAFFAAAERLWFLLRVLLVFRFRQFVETLTEIKVGTHVRDIVRHSVRLEPRERDTENIDPPFFASLEPYLAKGATALLTLEHNRELMHAAAYGYAQSYTAAATETRLTTCIEGIERLVEAFEKSRGLTRETIDQKHWKKLGKAARRLATSVGETPEERNAIDRALSNVPTLHLIERIKRMVRAQPPKWRKLPEELLKGAKDMINARNSIVHGRMVQNPSALHIETLRARALFERLWLCLLNCGDLPGEGWAVYEIRTYSMANAKIDDE